MQVVLVASKNAAESAATTATNASATAVTARDDAVTAKDTIEALNVVVSDDIDIIDSLTEAEFEAITSPDSRTLYIQTPTE